MNVNVDVFGLIFGECTVTMICNVRNNEKALREMQTLLAGCSKADPKILAPLQTPFLGVQESQNVISWRWSLPSPTDPVW